MRLECCWGGRRCVTVSSLTTQARRRNTSRIPWPSQRQALSPRHCEPHQPSQAIAGVSHHILPCVVLCCLTSALLTSITASSYYCTHITVLLAFAYRVDTVCCAVLACVPACLQ